MQLFKLGTVKTCLAKPTKNCCGNRSNPSLHTVRFTVISKIRLQVIKCLLHCCYQSGKFFHNNRALVHRPVHFPIEQFLFSIHMIAYFDRKRLNHKKKFWCMKFRILSKILLKLWKFFVNSVAAWLIYTNLSF